VFARCCFRLMGCAQTRVSLSRRTLIGFGASVTKMGFHAQPRADTLKATVSVNKRRAGVIARAETGPPGRPAVIWGTPGLLAGGSPLGRAPMHKPNGLHLLAALLAFTALAGAYAFGAELEGALQYPPRSVGEDAQPPPPARTLPQPLSPWRVELGVSGSSEPPGTQRFYILSPLRLDGPGAAPPSAAGGG
jgi:hypothetical protein